MCWDCTPLSAFTAEMCGLRTRQSADPDPQDFFCLRGRTRILFRDEICGRGLTADPTFQDPHISDSQLEPAWRFCLAVTSASFFFTSTLCIYRGNRGLKCRTTTTALVDKRLRGTSLCRSRHCCIVLKPTCFDTRLRQKATTRSATVARIADRTGC